MKNANVFVDVDLTLVDARGQLIDGAREGLRRLQAKGCHLFLWSTVGAEYARATATRHSLTDLFEGFAAKPDIVIDDMPGTVLNPFVFNPNETSSWQSLAEKIIEEHIDE